MKKIINRFKNHVPTKRRLIQWYAALLFNANLKGFATGKIYTGGVKNICTPGLNCYSCPAASGACPLGALQNSLSSSGKTVPYYVFGIIMLYGLFFGRWICGFLCPMGLIQELLHKIPTPKLKKGKVTRILSYFKYVVLVFFVFIVPLLYAVKDFPLPGFCKYICPAGTLEGAMGLLSNTVENAGMFRMLGPLFTWKFLLMISFFVACVFIYRLFCRFLCPLGAIYGLFNKISFVGVKVDQKSCTDCGICTSKCKMDVKHVGDQECIMCGECISACPTQAISWKGGKILLAPNAIEPLPEDATEAEADAFRAAAAERNAKIQKRNNVIKTVTGIVMAVVLAGALIYYNFIDGRETTPVEPPVTETETADPSTGETETRDPDDTSTESETEPVIPAPPVGTKVGNTCPTMDVTLFEGKGNFNLADMKGKVVVLNFWYTTCTPCLAELPYFSQVATDYKDKDVVVLALHIQMPNVNVDKWIDQNYPGSDMLFGWDEGNAYTNTFGFQAFPCTVVVDKNGVITDKYEGGLHLDELTEAVEKALANH